MILSPTLVIAKDKIQGSPRVAPLSSPEWGNSPRRSYTQLAKAPQVQGRFLLSLSQNLHAESFMSPIHANVYAKCCAPLVALCLALHWILLLRPLIFLFRSLIQRWGPLTPWDLALHTSTLMFTIIHFFHNRLDWKPHSGTLAIPGPSLFFYVPAHPPPCRL